MDSLQTVDQQKFNAHASAYFDGQGVVLDEHHESLFRATEMPFNLILEPRP